MDIIVSVQMIFLNINLLIMHYTRKAKIIFLKSKFCAVRRIFLV